MIPYIITNNPRVSLELSKQERIGLEFLPDKSQEEILLLARDRIHLGAKLVIHPMMGRIKPHETPYKSVFLELPDERETGESGANPDFTSISIIEESIAETSKLLHNTYQIKYDINDLNMLSDLAYIDYLLIQSGLEEYLR